ncbi:MAG: hypothetical protein ACF8AM_24595 [Rhodopirellula sp. JB055]|uniref:hypothetical protein n=1 Tax=Rhodopirellula sp. JB055 TaxID=3342846 RepID=UPI00370C6D5A
MRFNSMTDPTQWDRFSQRCLSRLSVFEYQLLQLRTMRAPLDSNFVREAFAEIQSIGSEAERHDLTRISDLAQSLETDLQTAIQQAADQACSPDAERIGRMLQETHRLRQRIQSACDVESEIPETQLSAEAMHSTDLFSSSHPDTRKAIRNAGTTKPPAPKRAQPEFTSPSTIQRLEDLLDQIQIQLDACRDDGESPTTEDE